MQSSSYSKLFKRGLAEKLLCFFIFLTTSTLFESFLLSILSKSPWDFAGSSWIFKKLYILFYLFYFTLLSICSFLLWITFSFKKLKLEISFFFCISLLSIIWTYSFIFKHNYFISLITMLFTLFISIILNMLVWKKSKISAIIFSYCTLWILYLFILNLFVSYSNY